MNKIVVIANNINFEDFDPSPTHEDLTLKLRYFDHYTIKKDYKLFGAQQHAAHSVAEIIIDTILGQGAEIIYEHRLQSLQNIHTIYFAEAITELNLLPHYLEEDTTKYPNDVDIEPVNALIPLNHDKSFIVNANDL